MAGYVYIFSNPKMNGMLKIGYTEKDPISRAKELSDSTAVPLPYEVEYQIYTTHPRKLEQVVHKNLRIYRVNKKREFFECSYENAVQAIRDGVHYLTNTNTNFSAKDEVSYKVIKQELEKNLTEKRKTEEKYRREMLVRQQRELEVKKIEDRIKLVNEFNDKKKKDEFLKRIYELDEYLSKRERYVYSRLFPLDDIELKNWILNLELDDSIIENYLEIHYPNILFFDRFRLFSYSNISGAPTIDDERKLSELEKFVVNKLRIKQEEEERLEKEKFEEEKRERLKHVKQEILELEAQTEKENNKLRIKQEEEERLEKEKFEEEKRERLKRVIQEILELEAQTEKEKLQVKNARWFTYINKGGECSCFVGAWFLGGTLLNVLYIYAFLSTFRVDIFLISGFILWFVSLLLTIFVAQKSKKYAIEKIDNEFQKKKLILKSSYENWLNKFNI